MQTNLEEEELVKEAASQVQETFQASISVASNILGNKMLGIICLSIDSWLR